MSYVGALYKDDCKYQKYIPIYLIVGGSFGIVRTLWTLCQKMCRSGEREEDEENRKMVSHVHAPPYYIHYLLYIKHLS